MSYPSHFYYTDKSSESQYSFTPQGSLDVGRLINGRPYWRKPSAGNQQPKSLILADWTAANWSQEKTRAVITKISELMADDFPLYYWQKGTLEPLTNPLQLFQLSSQDIRDAITPLLPETLITVARAQYSNLNQNNTVILDDYNIDSLIKNSDTSLRSFDVNNLTDNLSIYDVGKRVISKFDIDLICTMLKKAIPPITKVIHSEYSWAANQVMGKIAEEFPLVNIEVQYRKLLLNSVQLQQLLKDKMVIIDGAHFN